MRTIDGIFSRLSQVKQLPLVSRLSPSSARVPETKDLQGFLEAQRLAYRCAIDIGRELQEGWTEIQTAALMDTYLRDNGVKTFFHRSFAWFGDRSGFHGMSNFLDFLPSGRRLEAGDVIVLDAAPILAGYSGDIGFTFARTPNEELAKARRFLLDLRQEIRVAFASDLPVSEIWASVDKRIRDEGYSNRHKRYPFQVLGHRVHRVPLGSFSGIVSPFTLHSYWGMMSRGIFPELLGPWHTGSKEGVWAIEPHLGTKGFGAKFEEILVVDSGKASWIDDEVPHVQLPEGFY